MQAIDQELSQVCVYCTSFWVLDGFCGSHAGVWEGLGGLGGEKPYSEQQLASHLLVFVLRRCATIWHGSGGCRSPANFDVNANASFTAAGTWLSDHGKLVPGGVQSTLSGGYRLNLRAHEYQEVFLLKFSGENYSKQRFDSALCPFWLISATTSSRNVQRKLAVGWYMQSISI